MSVPLFGLIVFPLCFLLWLRPARMLEVLLLAGAFPAAAALVLGGGGVQPVLVPTLGFISYAMLQRMLGARYPGDRAARALYMPFVLTAAWAVLGSVILPRVFMNSVLVWPQRNDSTAQQVLLAPSFGNITQDIYLMVNVMLTVLAAGFLTRADIRIDRLYRAYLFSGWVVCILCFWQLAHRLAGVPFPSAFLYSNPGWVIFDGQMAGSVPRINGSFTEPSACGAYLSGILYSTIWAGLQGYRLRMLRALIPVAAVALLTTTSTTGFATMAVGFLILPAAALATGSIRLFGRVGRFLAIGAAIAGFGSLVLITIEPRLLPAMELVFQSTADKQDSESYQERSMADRDALAVVPQTFGLGSGWGSNRASSLIPSLLSTIGVVGVAGMLIFDVRLVRSAMQARRLVPICPERLMIDGGLAALAGRMVAAIMSGPTIGFPDFYLMMAMVIAAVARIRVWAAENRWPYETQGRPDIPSTPVWPHVPGPVALSQMVGSSVA
ncbi:conserved hypothetical protein [Gluconacetobacter diazotrophicus PA1 5]|uniref:O-antigen polymerase n=2 Tax=Gluconacetobacter diazotrophicus TaxID=33996 RepID=A0A7W4FDG9_GLUDI|nr:hypothetical protein [Gluconacetobacter diazotrophicus]ACI50522.1 conserved hypothetical protein [Gluconacetobacter diazotrophicus PA1 5]MBB2155715.1 hypothetical protein [Gluconacetobacter diazotrophicus]TWB09354.1 hypothetical protein FBZ86_10416 [Gluconacetobacter diazotrophicus]CAP56430.1 putative membrane protein [Gluconacetobacter diazotrophicus PA1 5]